MIYKILTKLKWKDQETNSKFEFTRMFASFFIALSGLLLYLDKVLFFYEIEGHSHGFTDYPTFIWVLMQSLAPIIMILAFYFKPYFTSFLIPVYCYTIQIIWIFEPNMKIDHPLLHVYAVGSCLSFLLLMFVIKKISSWRMYQTTLKKEFQQETQEILHILKAKTISEN